ncbi:MAG: 5'(3')-deoxyribonucleotidase [Massilibacteroides sp.]|nr:5'(3')-deoxyribonucleotidase [Massilibacteroides sp.]
MGKTILVDMDGVLADIYTQLMSWEYKKSGKTFSEEDLYGKAEDVIFTSLKEHLNSLGFFRTAPLVKDSVEGLNYLNEKYKVLIVSSATEFDNCLNDKRNWLTEYFPFISWKQMIFCGNKEHIKGDIMIDDHFKNLSVFDGRRILFTQPHNMFIHDETLESVFNWKEVIEKF